VSDGRPLRDDVGHGSPGEVGRRGAPRWRAAERVRVVAGRDDQAESAGPTVESTGHDQAPERASRSSRSHTLLGDQTRVNDLVGAGHSHHCGRGGCSDGRGRARQRHRLRRSLDRLACDGCRHCMQRGRPGRHGHRRRYIRGNGDHRRRSWRGRGVSRHGHRDCELLGRRSRRQCDRRIGSPHGDRHLYRRGSPVVSVRVTTEPSGTSQPLRSTSAPVWPPP
jgi:hypothetical protein